MTRKRRIILGTMTFGATGDGARIKDPATVQKVFDVFKSHGHNELDTARMYCEGNTEKMLGDLHVSETFKIATKVYPSQLGDHEPEKLKATFRTSLAALQQKKVDLFYLHAPDKGTPFEDTLRAVQDLYEEGLFTELGISNFTAWQLTEIYYICKNNGWVLPTVYQGMYNAITRDVERELFSCLSKFNIRFYAYNPIAGGAFSPNIKIDNPVEEVCANQFTYDSLASPSFLDLLPIQSYRERYWNDVYLSVIQEIHTVAAKHNISTIDVALRWMVHHSKLNVERGDVDHHGCEANLMYPLLPGIIIGVSSIAHTEQNLLALDAGPLPDELVEALDAAWETTKAQCPPYFR
ncbi:Aldo/keto reductase [Endogone sp. FLAS-F59071]|nr:Aldo/keto reductase [Endogone sp. FLAS-F59071]|eukprot:RUS16720.1 Aldo/keto reductase [Endogone sp. FLAS-F59071]